MVRLSLGCFRVRERIMWGPRGDSVALSLSGNALVGHAPLCTAHRGCFSLCPLSTDVSTIVSTGLFTVPPGRAWGGGYL